VTWLLSRVRELLPRIPPNVREVLLRVAGSVVACWAAVVLALFGAFMTPFRIGSVLAPISLVLAIGGNAGIIWFAYRVTRHKLLALLPGLVWTVLTLIGSGKTSEGDLILYQSNWVATVYLYAGCATVGVAGYRLIVPKPPRPGLAPSMTTPAATPEKAPRPAATREKPTRPAATPEQPARPATTPEKAARPAATPEKAARPAKVEPPAKAPSPARAGSKAARSKRRGR